MRPPRQFQWLLVLCLAIATHASSVEDAPQCAQLCIQGTISRSDCVSSSLTCLCNDGNLMKSVADCVVSSCLPIDALATQNLTWTACGFPVEDDFETTKIPRLLLFLLLATPSIIFRVIVKLSRISSWGADDAFILIAYFVLVALVPINVYIGHNGTGKDMWTLTPEQITNYYRGFYIVQIFYHCSVFLIKASIIFTFIRIFTGEKIRAILVGTQVFNLMLGISFTLVGIFQCRPISLSWTLWRRDPNRQGSCLNIVLVGTIHGAIQVALDIWMLVLPGTQVMGLNMQKRKKFAVLFLFSLGLFSDLNPINYAPKLTQYLVDTLPIVIWSDIELCAGVFTACIPTTRQFFCKFVFRKAGKVTSFLSSEKTEGDRTGSTHKSPVHASTNTVDEEK
nr:CFEM domain-containing protein [Colletotrichum truncatum]KAF6785831.1 CFEM domain-containing protein [Colletotrichum truncatum]